MNYHVRLSARLSVSAEADSALKAAKKAVAEAENAAQDFMVGSGGRTTTVVVSDEGGRQFLVEVSGRFVPEYDAVLLRGPFTPRSPVIVGTRT